MLRVMGRTGQSLVPYDSGSDTAQSPPLADGINQRRPAGKAPSRLAAEHSQTRLLAQDSSSSGVRQRLRLDGQAGRGHVHDFEDKKIAGWRPPVLLGKPQPPRLTPPVERPRGSHQESMLSRQHQVASGWPSRKVAFRSDDVALVRASLAAATTTLPSENIIQTV